MGRSGGVRTEGEEVRGPQSEEDLGGGSEVVQASIERARVFWGAVQAGAVVAAVAIDWLTGGVAALSVLMGLLMVMALLEFYGMAGPAKVHRVWGSLMVAVLAGGPIVSQAGLGTELEWSAVALAVFMLGLLLVDWLAGGVANGVAPVAVTALGVVYVWGLLGFVVRLAGLEATGVGGVVMLLAVAKGSDITAYFVGTRLGRLRLAPRVSPGKSLEGSVGALLVSLGLAPLVAWAFSLPLSWELALLFGLVVSLAAQLGDLGESLLKRKFKAKDSARLLPGFGGVLDMVDSLAGAAPVAYVFFRVCT